MSSTIKLSQTVTWAKSFTANLDPTIMTGNEPAITSANLVKSTILGPPFTWRWNRVITGFVAAGGTQDYFLTSWSPTSSFALGAYIIDTNGNSQKVTTAGTSGSSQPTWNATSGQTTTDGSVVWTNQGSIGGGSSSYNLGFIESASVQDLSPAKWHEINTNRCLSLDSSQDRPREISAQKDDNAGNITFRLMPVPDEAYPVSLTLQQKPTLFAALSDTWSPIPDELSYIYNWGFLTLMYLYADDNRWAFANQKFVSALLGTQQGLTETERNIFLNRWEAISGQVQVNALRTQQGIQARSV